MSTVAAPETTKTEPETKTADPAPPTPTPVGAKAVILEGGLEGILKAANPKKDKKPDAKKPEAETKADDPAKADPEKKPEAKTDPGKADDPEKKTPAPEDKSLETNIVKLRETLDSEAKGRKDAEAQLAKLQVEIESIRKNPVPDDVQKKLSDLEAKNGELSKLLRAASIERDPEFVEKFRKGRQAKLNSMYELAKEAGVDEKEAMSAFRSWNEDAFGTWMENMSPGQKAKFQAAWSTLLELDQQRASVVENADKEWEKMTAAQQERAKEAQRAAAENISKTAKTVVSDLFKIEGLPDDPTFRASVEDHVMQAAGLKESDEPWDDARWLKTVALNQALGHATMSLREEVDGLTAKLAEKDKKIADLEAFVASAKGSAVRTPGSGPINPSGDSDKRPIWERISVKVP